MADREVESSDVEVPEIPEILERVLLFSLDEDKEKMTQGSDVVPFTALVVKENLFIENHPADSAEECFNLARHTVEHARGAAAYALCYDGYIEIDDGVKDALIAEGGVPGEDTGYAVSYLYEMDEEGNVTFEEEPAYVGEAPNFMIALNDADSYAEEDIDEKYLEEDAVDDEESPRPSERMFHVKHSHKRKFLRIGRILQRCGRFACAASSAARDAASAFGDAASAFGDAASAVGGATSPGGDATSPGGGAVSGVGRPPAFRVREAPKWFPLRRKRLPAAAARAAAAGFSTTRDHPIVACVASSHPRRWSSPR